MKYYILALFSVFLVFSAGCGKTTSPGVSTGTGQNESLTADKMFSAPQVPVTFRYQNYLQIISSTTGKGVAVAMFKKRADAPQVLDQFLFSTKTHDAWVEEMSQANARKNKPVCESEAQFGCEKWDEDYALYQKAVKENNFDGYYVMAGARETINGNKYIVLVSYNVDTKQYQTTYITYVNNTRITFVDPAAGALEYGQPFYMNAKNRSTVEETARNMAARKNLDPQVNARAALLHDIVSSVEVK